MFKPTDKPKRYLAAAAFAAVLITVPCLGALNIFRMRMLLFLSRLQKAESVSARLKNLEVVPGQPLPEKIWKITRIL